MSITVNGVAVDSDNWPTPQLAAVHELLRQRASELGFVADDAGDADTERAIERTLAEEVPVPEPSDEECRRWYEANAGRFRSGDLVCARHILFQVTPGAPVPAIRGLAEAMLHELRANPALFDASRNRYRFPAYDAENVRDRRSVSVLPTPLIELPAPFRVHWPFCRVLAAPSVSGPIRAAPVSLAR